MKIHGPYTYNSGPNKGRRYVNIRRDDGSKTSMLYSRYIYEATYGSIPEGMQVDHIDEDKTNDAIENLQLLTSSDNLRKNIAVRPREELVTFTCPQCGNEATKLARNVRANQKKGHAGPFCGRTCAGNGSK